MLDATATLPARTITNADLFAADFLAGYDGHTLAAYTLDLELLFRWCATQHLQPLGATRTDVEGWLRHLAHERGNCVATVKRRLAVARRFYALAAHDGLVAIDPTVFARVPRAARPSTPPGPGIGRHELAALLMAARKSRPVDSALIALLGLLGLRVGEACSLTVAAALHMEQEHRVLRFVGKGNKPACLPMPPIVWREVSGVIGNRAEGPLLIRPDGAGMNRAAAARIIDRLAVAAGIERRITPHDLRRGFTTAMLDAGVSFRDVQEAGRLGGSADGGAL